MTKFVILFILYVLLLSLGLKGNVGNAILDTICISGVALGVYLLIDAGRQD